MLMVHACDCVWSVDGCRLDRDGEQLQYFASQVLANLTNTSYLPSTTFPAGLGVDSGMPVGLNAVGAEYGGSPSIYLIVCAAYIHVRMAFV